MFSLRPFKHKIGIVFHFFSNYYLNNNRNANNARIKTFYCIFLCIVLSQVHGDLLLKPSAASLTRDQYRSFVASCSGQSNTRVIGWRSPKQMDIPENEHDRYENDVLLKNLYEKVLIFHSFIKVLQSHVKEMKFG